MQPLRDACHNFFRLLNHRTSPSPRWLKLYEIVNNFSTKAWFTTEIQNPDLFHLHSIQTDATLNSGSLSRRASVSASRYAQVIYASGKPRESNRNLI